MDSTLTLGFSLLAGLGVLSIFYGLTMPRRPLRRAHTGAFVAGIQVRLTQAQLDIGAPQFLARGALLGAALGLAAALIVPTPWVALPFFIGGFFVYRVHLEDRRNRRVNAYHHDLAQAMDFIVNQWRVQPSLDAALQTVVEHGPGAADGPDRAPTPGSVADDFARLRRGLRTGTRLRTLLQRVADRRRSPIFDGLAMALLVAEERGAQASAILEHQAEITRAQVALFRETLAQQQARRNDVLIGTVGPWAIYLLTRLMSGDAGAASINATFFRAPAGALVALAAGAITVGAYVWAMRIASQDLLLTRVPTEHGKEEVAS
jgi:Flp pilus assembly protein TadB